MTQSAKVVYIPMAADILHPGHLNVINEGRRLGRVVVGLLTDEAIAAYKRVPVMNYEQRLAVISSIKGVDEVVPQHQLDYIPNLRTLKPAYLVHGSDWQTGVMQGPRERAISVLSEWGGQVVEPPYTEGISSSHLIAAKKSRGITPGERLASLGRLLQIKPVVKALEAHNGLSALIAENVSARSKEGAPLGFDAIWVSSLTDSVAKGQPDNESVDFSSRLGTINQILEVTTKPVIVDGDTGGHPEHFARTVRSLERLGVSAVVIEDKRGLKQNSLQMTQHVQEKPAIMAEKIRSGVKARLDERFLIIARIESLIVGRPVAEALERAEIYLKAGAGAIMIHSKDPSGLDVKEFAAEYGKWPHRRPLMVVPTSYNQVTDAELVEWGAQIVVYANHLLRAAYPAMVAAAESILKQGRAYEAEEICLPIPDFLGLVGSVDE